MKNIIILIISALVFSSCSSEFSSYEEEIVESVKNNPDVISVEFFKEYTTHDELVIHRPGEVDFILCIQKNSILSKEEDSLNYSLAGFGMEYDPRKSNYTRLESYGGIFNFSEENEEVIKDYLSEKIDLAILRYQIAELTKR